MSKQKLMTLVANARPQTMSTRHMMIVSIVAMSVSSTVAIVGLATTVPARRRACVCSASCCSVGE